MQDVMARFGTLYAHAMEAVTTSPHPALRDEVVFSFASSLMLVIVDWASARGSAR